LNNQPENTSLYFYPNKSLTLNEVRLIRIAQNVFVFDAIWQSVMLCRAGILCPV